MRSGVTQGTRDQQTLLSPGTAEGLGARPRHLPSPRRSRAASARACGSRSSASPWAPLQTHNARPPPLGEREKSGRTLTPEDLEGGLSYFKTARCSSVCPPGARRRPGASFRVSKAVKRKQGGCLLVTGRTLFCLHGACPEDGRRDQCRPWREVCIESENPPSVPPSSLPQVAMFQTCNPEWNEMSQEQNPGQADCKTAAHPL